MAGGKEAGGWGLGVRTARERCVEGSSCVRYRRAAQRATCKRSGPRGTSTKDRITLHNDQFLPFSIYLRIADPLAELEHGPMK